jgi:DNA-directed RNA polymerase
MLTTDLLEAQKELEDATLAVGYALAEGEARESVLLKRHEALVEELDVGLGWPRSTQALVGQTILGVALLTLKGIFFQETVIDKRGRRAVLRITDEAATKLEEVAEAVAWMKPPLQPMVIQPRPWTTLGTGCYLDPRLSRAVPLVRTYSNEHKKLIREALKDGSMQEVLDAVNAIQETRWAIDTRVLALVQWARENRLKPSASFPASTLPDMPKKATAEEWALMEQGKRTAMSRNRKAIRDIRSAAAIDAGVFLADIEQAAFLADYEFFTLPHSLDFRGRTYAVPYFNHQRSDHLKGLFHFADGFPLGPDGGDWLMIHLANCGDFGKVSKKPFADRIAWVRENEGDILMAARYPEETYDYWSKADSPFCFLQACFEYDAWMREGFSENFVSTVAIAADGSCSGLQHYAALTRSAEEAHHVNLTPRDTVGDIYQVVADAAVPTLKMAAQNGDELAVGSEEERHDLLLWVR